MPTPIDTSSHASHKPTSPYRRVFSLLLGVLLSPVESLNHVSVLIALGTALLVLHFPAHEVATERKQGEIDADPGEEHAEVDADARV